MGIPYPLQSMWAGRKCATQKSKSELVGLVQGILSDGAIVEPEARFLREWIAAHFELRNQWPCNVLFRRIDDMLSDGVLDSDEQAELLRSLLEFIQLREAAEKNAAALDRASTSKAILSPVTVDSPFDDPAPGIEHLGRMFVVTGDFACAKRSAVVSRIESLGGSVNGTVSKKIHYLVVGSLGSELWKAQGYGTKIEKAVELRRGGAPIRIVAEETWFRALPAE